MDSKSTDTKALIKALRQHADEWHSNGAPHHEVATMRDAADRLAEVEAHLAESDRPTRFCPECGCVGPVTWGKRDCCPDGSRARYVPERIAKRARDEWGRADRLEVELAEARQKIADLRAISNVNGDWTQKVAALEAENGRLEAGIAMYKADYEHSLNGIKHEYAKLEAENERLRNGNTALIGALMDMVHQHFYHHHDGSLHHSFMSADEGAIEVLIDAGYAEEAPGGGYRLLWDKLAERKNALAAGGDQ